MSILARLSLIHAFAAFALPLTFSVHAYAQITSSGSIHGRIENSGAGTYLNNVRVRVVGNNREAFTNEAGEYHLDNLPAGSVTLDVYYTGSAPQQATVSVEAGKDAEQNFIMRSSSQTVGADEVITLNEFTVTSTREINAAALAINEQRFAANIKNVVSTDAFGEINQGNIGEFVKHLPGVNIEFKDGNNASGILVRGFGSNYTNVTMNGGSLASAAIANTQNPSRQFSLEQANINNIARIEVTKEPLPDTPANSLGGSVNLITKTAFEYTHPQLFLNLSGSLNSYAMTIGKAAGPGRGESYKILPTIDATYILPFSKTLGIVANVSESDQFYTQIKSSPGRIYTSAGATVANPYTRSDGFSLAPNEFERTSASIQVDWKPTPHNVFQLTGLASAIRQDSASRSVSYNVGNAIPLAWGETFTHGGLNPVNTNLGGIGGTWQNRNSLTRAVSGKYTFESGPWLADFAASYSNSNNRARDMDKGFFLQMGTSLRGGRTANLDGIDNGTSALYGPTVLDANGNKIDTTKLANYDLSSVVSQPLTTQDSVTEFRANVKRDFEVMRIPLSIKVGGLTTKLVRDIHYTARTWTYVGPDHVAASGDENMSAFADPLLSGTSPSYGLPTYEWQSPWAVYDAFKAHPDYFTRTPTQLGDEIRNLVQRSPIVRERLSDAYAMADVKFFRNRVRLVGGVRYESTDDSGYGYKQDGNAIYVKDAKGIPVKVNGAFVLLPQLTGTVSGGPEQNALIYTYRNTFNRRNYDGYFPSFAGTYNITENLILRVAYAKTIGRPSYTDIVPNIVVSPNTGFDPSISGSSPGTITTSNTTLKPWTAKNYDVSLEYYFPHNGVISAGVFRKDVKDFFLTVDQKADQPLLDAIGFSSDYLEYTYRTRINGGDARLNGVEFNYSQNLDFIPWWGKCFSIQANYTKISVAGTNGNPSTFNSFIPLSGNAGLSFSKSRLSLGTYWNYRGRQIRSTSNAFPGATEYIMPIQTWDANIEYRITKHISVFTACRNLNNAVQKWALIGPGAPSWSYVENNFTNGRQFSLGVKGTF